MLLLGYDKYLLANKNGNHFQILTSLLECIKHISKIYKCKLHNLHNQ